MENSLISTLKGLIPRKGSFGANVLSLMTGTTVAQGLLIIATPVLTRLYTPEDFGIFALFFAMTQIISVIACGRYELAIMLPEKDESAFNVLSLSVLIVLGMSAFSLVVVVGFRNQIAFMVKTPQLAFWLWCLPVSLFLSGLSLPLGCWSTRQNRFNLVSLANIIRSVVTIGIQIIIGFLGKAGSLGLIVGLVLGQLIGTSVLIHQIFSDYRAGTIFIPSLTNIKHAALRYKKNPIFLTGSHLLNVLTMHMPVVILTYFSGAAISGIYSLCQRTLGLPSALVGQAISQVFFPEASRRYRDTGSCRALYIKTVKQLIYISLGPFLIILFLAPHIFTLVFGSQWQEAGVYAQILAPIFFIRFIFSPLSSIFMVTESQVLDFFWQMIFFVSTSLGLIFGAMKDPRHAIIFYSLAYFMCFILNGLLSYNLSVRNDNLS